jgi:hypothetical protein
MSNLKVPAWLLSSIAGAAGDKAAIGFLFGLIRDVTALELVEYIRTMKPLFSGVSAETWAEIRPLAQKAKIDLSHDRVIEEFRTRRLDLLAIIINCPGGLDWLDAQITTAKRNLQI